jgi:hypothetical protein
MRVLPLYRKGLPSRHIHAKMSVTDVRWHARAFLQQLLVSELWGLLGSIMDCTRGWGGNETVFPCHIKEKISVEYSLTYLIPPIALGETLRSRVLKSPSTS